MIQIDEGVPFTFPRTVFLGHRAVTALLQWQARLCAVECLDLGLFVDAQHERLVREIEVQPGNIVELLNKLLIAAKLERFGQMRLEIVLFPDAAHGGFTHTLSFGHRPSAPVSCVFGLTVQRSLNKPPDSSVGDSGNAPGAGSILLKPRQTQSQKTLPPELYR